MTAESGETWWAWRRTSTPSTAGILMSVTITSNRALSILRLAASPPVTVSTLWPSRRRAMSSSSQMERSSSQTRMLPTVCSSRGGQRDSGGFRRGGSSAGGGLLQSPQPQHEAGALADFGTRPHLALMGLDDLVHDGEAESGSVRKAGLEGLEDLIGLLRIDAGAGIGEAHFPVGTALGQGYGERPTLFRRLDCAHGVFREVPEHLFELVAIGQNPGLGLYKVAFEFDARALGGEAVFEQGESVLEQRNQIDALEAILFAARVGQKIGDDVVEAIGLADDNLEQVALIGAQSRRIRQHGDRAGNGSQGVADFVRDGGGEAGRAGQVADFGIASGHAEMGQGILKEAGYGASAQLGFGDSEQLLGGSIDQRDAPVEPGGDDPAAHGLHDIFVERLQVFEGAAGVFQLHINLAELAHQQARQVGDGEIGE